MSDTLCPTCQRGLHADELDHAICRVCVRTIAGWLRELPAQLVVLRGSRQREVGDTQRVAGSRTAPLPGRLDVLNLLGPGSPGDVRDKHGDQTGPLPIVTVLGSWVRLVVEERGLNGPRAQTEEHLADYLGRHLDWAAAQEWAGEMHDELGQMIRAIRGITSVRPRTRTIPVPCPRCDSLGLQERDHQTYIDCGVCEALFTHADLALDAHLRIARNEHQGAAA